MTQPHRHDDRPMVGPSRRGLTLVELLVVVTVLVLLAAITIPMMQPMLRGREVRETARQISSLLRAAQAQAAARGRPVGVMFHRKTDPAELALQSFQMSIAEVPPPYSGDMINARAFISNWTARLTGSPQLQSMVVPGDLIKFDYRGPHYVIDSISANAADSNVTFRHATASSDATALPPQSVGAGGDLGLPFQIYRRPQRTPAAPLELRAPAIVDLSYSGIGSEGPAALLFANRATASNLLDDPVIIMFSSSGRVDRVYVAGESVIPLGPIYLLVGRVDQLNPADPQKMNNLQDMNNLWLTIGHRTGLTTTAPNNVEPGVTDVAVARDLARTGLGVGGG